MGALALTERRAGPKRTNTREPAKQDGRLVTQTQREEQSKTYDPSLTKLSLQLI